MVGRVLGAGIVVCERRARIRMIIIVGIVYEMEMKAHCRYELVIVEYFTPATRRYRFWWRLACCDFNRCAIEFLIFRFL